MEKEAIQRIWARQVHPKLAYPIRLLMRSWLTLYFNSKVTLTANPLPALPDHGSFLLCANHCSHMDSAALIMASQRSMDDFVLMAAKDYFFAKNLRNYLYQKMLNLLPFDRSGGQASFAYNMELIRLAKDAGKIIVIYPEGTRSKTGEVGRFKTGFLRISEYFHLPILPARITGTQNLYPKGASWPPKSGSVHVQFGEYLPPFRFPEESTAQERHDYLSMKAQEIREFILRLPNESL